MPIIEEVAESGAAGRPQSARAARPPRLRGPQELYALWEREQWRSHAIDFARDREQWPLLDDEQRDFLAWMLSSFFVGEERVSTQFCGLLMAYADEHEQSFLASQQADEARHMQFFDRVYREVIGLEQQAFDGRLRRVREELGDAFSRLFDESLVDAGRRLVADPADLGAKVDFVATYHMVIEGTLALAGQRYVTDYLERAGIMPGLLEGFRHVARDEHRHIAYGAWFLARTAGEQPALAERLRRRLHELIPLAARLLTPPGRDPSAPWRMLGRDSGEVRAFAFTALSRRLKAIGVPLAPLAAGGGSPA